MEEQRDLRVLIVDDDPVEARTMVRLLGHHGFTCIACHDAASALEAAEKGGIGVVLADVHLGDVSGIELLRAFRLFEPDLPVILVSGHATLETALEAVELSATRYVQKPVPPEMLIGIVEQALRQREMAALRDVELLDDNAEDAALLTGRFERALRPLWVAYQPIHLVGSPTVYGYEALVRSDEPSLATPMELIAVAIKLGREQELYRAIRRSIADTASRLPPEVRLFVNVAPRELEDHELYSPSSPLSQHASRVVLEVGGKHRLERNEDLAERAELLRKRGYRIAVDDAGEGQGTLHRIAELEPDYVKLDRAMAAMLHRSARRRRFLEGFVGLMSKLMISPIATGVERREERDAFLELGITLQQGFFYATPRRSDGPPRDTEKNLIAAANVFESGEHDELGDDEPGDEFDGPATDR